MMETMTGQILSDIDRGDRERQRDMQANGQAGGWAVGQTGGHAPRQVGGQTAQVDRLAHKRGSWIHRQVDRQADRWTDGQTNMQTGGQPARWTDMQTDRQTCR